MHVGWGMIVRLVVCLMAMSLVLARPSRAQVKKDAAPSSVFDDEKDGDVAKKKDDAKKDDRKPGMSEREVIGFTQQNAAAQMTELEERMFRLSEALRGLEPENASRLSLALRFSREELILEQMRETYGLLKDEQLNRAETEAKELIAKLEHLRNLLLAEDLDFQLKLARLRQMRETLGQLDRIVKEQRRVLGWSRFALAERQRLDRMTTRRPDLDTIARDQQQIISDAKAVTKDAKDSVATREARGSLKTREAKLRGAVAALANDPLFADLQPPHLRRADTQMADVVTAFEGTDVAAAVAAAEKALEPIRQELTRFDERLAQSRTTIAEAAFKVREQDQSRNRETTDRLAVTSARLGDTGVAVRKDLIRAVALMQSAAAKLGRITAGPAAEDQTTAVEILSRSRSDLARSIERLLEELRSELRHRLIGDLTEMHEDQMFVRETSQSQVPRIAQKSRTALLAVTGLSKRQNMMAEKIEHLLALVEEVEYGVALPTTLRILGREMKSIGGWLQSGDVAPRTIAMETRIEEDLVKLAGAIRQLPSETPPPPDAPFPQNTRERERELSRLIAELTMVRMLQARLNDDTTGIDKTRPAAANPPPAIRREIETLEATQDEIRESLARIGARLPFPGEDEP